MLNPNGIGNASEVIVGTALADVISGGGGNDAIYGEDIDIVESGALFNFEDFGDTGLTQLELVNKGPSFRVGNGLAIDEVRFTQTVAQDIVIAAVNNLGVAQIFSGIERLVIGTGLLTAADRTGLAAINIDASLANVGLNLGLEILGNAGANILIGTAFDDIIDGGAGADAMEGTLGNDVYIVDNTADVIIELGGGGTDSVIVDAAVNYILAADLENLTLRNVGALVGTGTTSTTPSSAAQVVTPSRAALATTASSTSRQRSRPSATLATPSLTSTRCSTRSTLPPLTPTRTSLATKPSPSSVPPPSRLSARSAMPQASCSSTTPATTTPTWKLP